MKKILFITSIVLTLGICSAFSQTLVTPNGILGWNTNDNIANYEIIFNNAPIATTAPTNGLGYVLLNGGTISQTSINSLIPANTPNGIYYLVIRNTDVNGLYSGWSTNLVINYANIPNPPGGLKIIRIQ